jgi:hypothetical protein
MNEQSGAEEKEREREEKISSICRVTIAEYKNCECALTKPSICSRALQREGKQY